MVSITLSLYFRRNTCEISLVIDLVSLRTSSCLLNPFVEITDHFSPSVCFVALLIFSLPDIPSLRTVSDIRSQSLRRVVSDLHLPRNHSRSRCSLTLRTLRRIFILEIDTRTMTASHTNWLSPPAHYIFIPVRRDRVCLSVRGAPWSY